MIEFNYQIDFQLEHKSNLTNWLSDVITSENYSLDHVNYVFCDDSYLSDINVKYLKHNTLTDIITFNYNLGKTICSDIYISVDRVRENAKTFKVSFQNELHRVMVHGILHLCGYNDEKETEKLQMRKKEDYYLSLRPL
ncbi:rRNA maturation RNase YbeY [Aureibaculum conchae]|uniref:rRNA maturation RNase YbeY n=1 Tax=Aureibaculum sp. 2308TA14-22 TaxID=3108392 RepID=UPI0033924D20